MPTYLLWLILESGAFNLGSYPVEILGDDALEACMTEKGVLAQASQIDSTKFHCIKSYEIDK